MNQISDQISYINQRTLQSSRVWFKTRSRWNEARTLTAGNQCRADKQASVRSSFSDLPSHRCRIPDSGDAPDRLRPLPFHHQRSPSSSLVNIPQATTPEPETHAIHTGHKTELSLSPDISGPADTRGTWTFGIPRTGRLIPRSSDSVDEPWELSLIHI